MIYWKRDRSDPDDTYQDELSAEAEKYVLAFIQGPNAGVCRFVVPVRGYGEPRIVLRRVACHIHSYVDITSFELSYQLQMCIVKLNCPAPYRWRWNDFFDWTYLKEDPRIREIRRIGLAISGGLSSSAIRPLSEALASSRGLP